MALYPRSPRQRRRRWLRAALALAALLIAADGLYVASLWPDFSRLARGPVPRSRFIKTYLRERPSRHWPRLRWQPVPLRRIPLVVRRAVILGEDSRFYRHGAFDFVAIRDALLYDLKHGHLVFGASTIDQQTVKNLLLSSDRSWLRKWHEAILTLALDAHLTKARILEIYLNTAELGRGIYGVEAASEAYFGVPIRAVSVEQAAEIAASLPAPDESDPRHRTNYFLERTRKLLALLEHAFPRRFPLGRSPAAPALRADAASSAIIARPKLEELP